jgi:hypothetical protein
LLDEDAGARNQHQKFRHMVSFCDKMYWRLKSIPELRDLPAPERRRLWKEANGTPLRLIDCLWLFLLFSPIVPLFFLVMWMDSLKGHHLMKDIVMLPICFGYPIYMFTVQALRLRPVLRRLRQGYGPPVADPPLWVSGHRYYCVIGAALCVLAAPMLLGHYLDGASRTWQGLLFGTIFVSAAAICFAYAAIAEWRARRRA